MMETNFNYTVILCKPRKPMVLSKILMDFQNTEFSHSAILHANKVIVEAHWPKARKLNLCDWLEKYEVVEAYDFVAPISKYVKYEKVLRSYIGTWYSLLQLSVIFVQNIFKKVGSYLPRLNINGNKLSICTEVCISVIKETTDYHLVESRDTVDLVELREACKKYGTQRKWENPCT